VGRSWRLGAELSFAEYSRFAWRQLACPTPLATITYQAGEGASAATSSAASNAAASGLQPSPSLKRSRSTLKAVVALSRELDTDGARRLVEVRGSGSLQLNGVRRTSSKRSFEVRLSGALEEADWAGAEVAALTTVDFEGDQVGRTWRRGWPSHAQLLLMCNNCPPMHRHAVNSQPASRLCNLTDTWPTTDQSWHAVLCPHLGTVSACLTQFPP
jgi:hypothetical protein